MDLLSLFSGISISRFIDLLRSVYHEGAYSYDPMSDEEPREPSDGELLGMVIDFLGGAKAVFDAKQEVKE